MTDTEPPVADDPEAATNVEAAAAGPARVVEAEPAVTDAEPLTQAEPTVTETEPATTDAPAVTDTEPATPSAPTATVADPQVGGGPLTVSATGVQPTEMTQAPARSANEAYVFAAVLCAVVGLVIPVLPAAAALMLLRATDDEMTGEPLRPQLVGVKSFARGLAWFDLAWMSLLTIAFLLSTLGTVVFQ